MGLLVGRVNAREMRVIVSSFVNPVRRIDAYDYEDYFII